VATRLQAAGGRACCGF